jgi:hypothetical protein
VEVRDDKVMDTSWELVDDAANGADGYSAMKVADLRAEIARRNKDRHEADCLPDDGRKADLIAALEADDE